MNVVRMLGDWLDDRTGYKKITREALYENIPGGARWRYVTGSMLVFAFVTQAITGIFLWMSYSPGSQNAWSSVAYIQYQMTGGWLLRGIHHYMAQMMVLLLPVHLLQVVWDKAYRAPREINYWLGLVLMLLVLGLGLTGYLLPWDQKGYWATKVATELAALAPFGEQLQKAVVGGSSYGHQTLTRFFALHAGVLPALLVIVLALHVAMFRKHGITAHSSPNREDQYFWPHQVFKDAGACFLMLGFVILLVCFVGAELGPPAEPTEPYDSARPEFYFLFLFQLLKKFKENEFLGAIVIPGCVMAFLFIMPIIGRIRVGHYLNVVALLGLLGAAGWLTYEALQEDNYAELAFAHPGEGASEAETRAHRQRFIKSDKFLREKHRIEREAERMLELVEYYGIPSSGPNELQATDPMTQGPRLFVRNCASCHSYLDPEGHGIAGPYPPEDDTKTDPYGAPNLYKFASREWVRGLLTAEQIVSAHYFGNTAGGQQDEDESYYSTMIGFVQGMTEEDGKKLDAVAAALSAEAQLPYQLSADEAAEESGLLAKGRAILTGDDTLSTGESCADCHTFRDVEIGSAPLLTGYGSYDWLTQMISNPEHEDFYGYEEGANDRMPAFRTEQAKLLTETEIDLIVRWLRGDDPIPPEEEDEEEEDEAEASNADDGENGEAAGDEGAENGSDDNPSDDDADDNSDSAADGTDQAGDDPATSNDGAADDQSSADPSTDGDQPPVQ